MWLSSAVIYLISADNRTGHPRKRGKQSVWTPTALGGASPKHMLVHDSQVCRGGEAPKPPLTFFEKKVSKETFKQKIHPNIVGRKRGTVIENQDNNTKQSGRLRDKKISFWASEAERNKILKAIKRTGMTQREYLLMAAQGKTIYQIDELKPTLHELKAIGRNLNQLTMLAHQGRITTVNLAAATEALTRNYIAINGLFEEANGAVASGNMPQEKELMDDGNV